MKLFMIVFSLLLTLPGLAKDSPAAAQAKWKKWLTTMQSIEKRVTPIRPIQVALAKQTPAQQKQITETIEFLDKLVETEVKPLSREINRYVDYPEGAAPTHQLFRKAGEELVNWTTAKLTLQNAGINNPSLAQLRLNEPKALDTFEQAWKAAQSALP